VDALLAWRKEFPILSHTTYMISHSLGAMPKRTVDARIHEYKRQLMPVLYIVVQYTRLKINPRLRITPRTFLIGGKAAPGYDSARSKTPARVFTIRGPYSRTIREYASEIWHVNPVEVAPFPRLTER